MYNGKSLTCFVPWTWSTHIQSVCSCIHCWRLKMCAYTSWYKL